MQTITIRQRVRENLNRDDPGIDAKIQGWVNDAKHFIEQSANFDYMRASSVVTVSSASQSASLPARLKSLITVRWRDPARDLVWFDLPRISAEEAAWVYQFDSSGNPRRGAPVGYDLTESTIVVWPQPDVTYELRLTYWRFSEDWQFSANEEPYLARVGWPAIIALATAFGYEYLGEIADATAWYQRAQIRVREMLASEHARMLEGEIQLRASTGAEQRRPTRSRGLLGL